MANRIVTELFLERPSFKEVSKVVQSLASDGIKAILMPPEDRGINTHLAVENSDVAKARKKLKALGMTVVEKEVVLIELENRPGTMAEAASRVSAKGVNLTYAFSVSMTSKFSYVLLGGPDNQGILDALK